VANHISSQHHDDYADDRFADPGRPSLMLPVATALAFAAEAALLLIARAHAQTTHYGLFHDVPVFLVAALPFAMMAGIGLLVRGDRSVQAALMPVLAILTLAGLWAAATKTTHTRGGFEEVGLVLAYLLQWLMVGLGVFVGFIMLATKRR